MPSYTYTKQKGGSVCEQTLRPAARRRISEQQSQIVLTWFSLYEVQQQIYTRLHKLYRDVQWGWGKKKTAQMSFDVVYKPKILYDKKPG